MKKTKAKKQSEGSLKLQLDGHVYLIDKEPGKRAVKIKLDDDLVLEALAHVIKEALEAYARTGENHE